MVKTSNKHKYEYNGHRCNGFFRHYISLRVIVFRRGNKHALGDAAGDIVDDVAASSQGAIILNARPPHT